METVAGTIQVRCVKFYKHMGGINHVSGAMGDEIGLRTASTYRAFNPIKKKVFANSSLPIDDRHMLAQALLFSRLFFNSATWEVMKPLAKGKLPHCYFMVFRVIHSMVNVKDDIDRPTYSNDQVIVAANIVHPEVCMLLSRLRYFIRFICHAPVSLTRFVLVQVGFKYCWIELVILDLEFVWLLSESLHTSMANPRTHLQEWINAFSEAPVHWKNTLRRICKGLKGKTRLTPSPAATVSLASHTCDQCDFACASIQQLYSHKFDLHGYVNPIRLRMKSSVCIACNIQFHSRARLFRHLTNRPAKNKCAASYHGIAPMSIEELKELEKSIPKVDKKSYLAPPVKLA